MTGQASPGPQRGPASVPQINAQVKQARLEWPWRTAPDDAPTSEMLHRCANIFMNCGMPSGYDRDGWVESLRKRAREIEDAAAASISDALPDALFRNVRPPLTQEQAVSAAEVARDFYKDNNPHVVAAR